MTGISMGLPEDQTLGRGFVPAQLNQASIPQPEPIDGRGLDRYLKSLNTTSEDDLAWLRPNRCSAWPRIQPPTPDVAKCTPHYLPGLGIPNYHPDRTYIDEPKLHTPSRPPFVPYVPGLDVPNIEKMLHPNRMHIDDSNRDNPYKMGW